MVYYIKVYYVYVYIYIYISLYITLYCISHHLFPSFQLPQSPVRGHLWARRVVGRCCVAPPATSPGARRRRWDCSSPPSAAHKDRAVWGRPWQRSPDERWLPWPLGGLKNLWLGSTLWLCQNSYWKWPFIVDFPIEHGDFP